MHFGRRFPAECLRISPRAEQPVQPGAFVPRTTRLEPAFRSAPLSVAGCPTLVYLRSVYAARPQDLGLVARVFRTILTRAVDRRQTTIAESEVAQIVRITVVGSGNSLALPPLPRSGAAKPNDAFIAALVAQCFQVVAGQPGLSVSFSATASGERTIRIENLAVAPVPSGPRLLEDAEEALSMPPRAIASSDETLGPVPELPPSPTGADYARYARRLAELQF